MEQSERINEAIVKIINIKMDQLMPLILEGRQNGIFINEITAKELMHIIIGAFRLQMFKWRLAKFKYDIVKSGNNLIDSLLKIIKS